MATSRFAVCLLTVQPVLLVWEIKEGWTPSFNYCCCWIPENYVHGKPRGPSTGRRYEFQCPCYIIHRSCSLSILSDVPTIKTCLILKNPYLHTSIDVPLQEVKGKGFLLVSTDIASRGFDLPQTSHIYNFDLPKTAIDYLHRAGRTGREPFSKLACSVTTLITEDEHFVLQRFQNELKFHCEELPVESMFAFNLWRPSLDVNSHFSWFHPPVGGFSFFCLI